MWRDTSHVDTYITNYIPQIIMHATDLARIAPRRLSDS